MELDFCQARCPRVPNRLALRVAKSFLTRLQLVVRDFV